MKYYHEPYKYYGYIMASGKNGTLYTGVTNDIARRSFEHKTYANSGGFTALLKRDPNGSRPQKQKRLLSFRASAIITKHAVIIARRVGIQ